GAWPATAPGAFGANGIRELSDASLLINNSAAGGLWQVNRHTGVAREIDVRGSGGNDVSVFRLRHRHGRWVATAQGTLTDATLDVPSTATFAKGSLWAV